MSRHLGLQGRPAATDGTFSVVLDDTGGPHFFSWIRPPADSAGAQVVKFAFENRWVSPHAERVVPALPVPALALEANLLRTCP
jgi:hypothetical protein